MTDGEVFISCCCAAFPILLLIGGWLFDEVVR
jgi:hypothetical protein